MANPTNIEPTQTVTITATLAAAFYAFTQNGGSDTERRLLGEHLLTQSNAAQTEAKRLADIASAREAAVAEYKAEEKAKKNKTVEAAIEAALSDPTDPPLVVPANDGVVTVNQTGNNHVTPKPEAFATWKSPASGKVRKRSF